MDRKTKLLALGVGGLVFVVLITIFIVSCSARKKAAEAAEPTPTPTDIIAETPEPTPASTLISTPAMEITLPEGITPTSTPTATAVPTATPKPIEQELPKSPTMTPMPKPGTTTKPAATTSPSGSGTKTITAPAFDFGLPAVASTGTQIAVQTSQKNIVSVEWSVTKDGVLGLTTNASEMTGTLTVNGGTISFSKAGKYTLTAIAKNSAGKAVTVTSSIEVFASGKFAFGLPQNAYTDTVVDVDVLDGADGSVTWSITKDGAAITLAEAYSGTLGDKGGMVTFRKEGKYVLTGKTASDKTHTDSIQVYSLLRFPFTLPATTYRNTEFTVTMGETYLNGQTLAWSMGKADTAVQIPAGALTNDGGKLSLPELGTYTLTASATDPRTGRVFTQTRKITAINQAPVIDSAAATVTNQRSGNRALVEFKATASDPDKDETVLEWDGRNADDMYTVGSHSVRVRAKDSAGAYSLWQTVVFEVPNMPPVIDTTATVEVRSDIQNAKVKYSISASASDPDGDPVTLEWDGRDANDYYALGEHTVRVRARDSFGAYSDWTPISFTVSNQAPARPTISRTPAEPFILPGYNVTITASAVDPDGDALTYVWENRPAETYAYPDGRQIVKVKAVDPFGEESPTKRIMFLMGDPNRAGNLMLTGPDSSISEPGIEDATLIYYKFVVPPVDGHYGQDYGRVRGYNRLTGQWDQLDYGTTENGISFERNLAAGTYTKLDLYYYTNHNCMYNKSNITYIALFEFDELEDD
jgi:large repetitive protein